MPVGAAGPKQPPVVRAVGRPVGEPRRPALVVGAERLADLEGILPVVRLGPEIVAAMQQLAAEQRRLLGLRAPWHVGDIAWAARQHEGREHEWTIRLWVSDGRTVAWSWLKGDVLEHDVHPEHLHLLDEILDEPAARVASAFTDDAERREALARHGFVEPGESLHFMARDLEERQELPPLPSGFRYRTVTGADLAERVAVHREVWAPSRVTESSYSRVRRQWPYRESLDCVVEAPDGRFAAYCLCWPDDENRVGEFEPVGVRPELRRRGLGAAVCAYALRRLYEEGGRQAIVYCLSEPACALYTSVGFRRHATLVAYARTGAAR
jgi:ribosomal protein S18 acetylase RimI-like enzyme